MQVPRWEGETGKSKGSVERCKTAVGRSVAQEMAGQWSCGSKHISQACGLPGEGVAVVQEKTLGGREEEDK